LDTHLLYFYGPRVHKVEFNTRLAEYWLLCIQLVAHLINNRASRSPRTPSFRKHLSACAIWKWPDYEWS